MRSQPVLVVENRCGANRAFCTINEGLGKVMRFGGNDASVLARLASIEEGVSTNADALESMRLARVEDTRNFASSTMMEIVVSDLEGVKRQMESLLDIVESGVDELDEIDLRLDRLESRVDMNEEACRSKKWCDDWFDDAD